ncbi:MAG: hypothetical protein PUF17_10445 [Lactimicrobium massiliense]|nr:hypothetical protein [Lactimicrobium massiliense]MDD6561364.1 hypothetical protein [Lactimicrobium massiliense]
MAKTSLAQAYVQIIPTADGIKGKITEALGGESDSAGKQSGETIGKGLVSKLKAIIVAAGIGKIVSDALTAGGNLQQSFGGLDTIYGEAADQAKKLASQAAAAGISANSYAEQAVSFGAALKQAYGGDLNKAVGAANTAIMDMADNSAKMGTDITSIQTAYQGFAKQNYTMLDNLKLGYGGTKQEMQRLLSDAEKISGVHYDISNLGDVYDAIHVIQGELGVTGVAAKEASTTFTGSMGAMKATAENVMAGLTLGMDVTPALQQLATSISDFVFRNLIPMLGNLIAGLPSALASFVQAAIPAMIDGVQGMISSISTGMDFKEVFDKINKGLQDALNYVHTSFPQFVQSGLNAILNFANGIFEQMPTVISNISTIIQNGLQVITAAFPVILNAGFQMIANLATGILNNLPMVIQNIGTILQSFLTQISQNLPQILDSGIQMIEKLADGIVQNMPSVIQAIGNILNSFINFIMQNLPTILQKGVELIGYLANGILQNLPAIIGAIASVIAQLLATIAQNLPQFLQKGIELLGQVGAGIIRAIPTLIGSIPGILVQIAGAFTKYDWLSIGANIIRGIASGITNAVTGLVSAAIQACKKLTDSVKSFFGISSPSKLMRREIGQFIPAGVALGIRDKTNLVKRAMEDMNAEIAGSPQAEISMRLANARSSEDLVSGIAGRSGSGSYTQNVTINSPSELNPSEIARQTRNTARQVILAMNGI